MKVIGFDGWTQGAHHYERLIESFKKNDIELILMGHDNLSMFKNLLKYRHESKKQVCNSFTYFRGQI